MTRRGLLIASLTLALGAASCTPSGGGGVLPAGVSVEWERDTGGAIDSNGDYTPAWSTSITNAAVTLGPFAGGTRTAPPTAFGFGGAGLRPDGTAKFPWNGYAGESISMPGPLGSLAITFPAGSCTLPTGAFDQIRGVSPSPDGTKAAMVLSNSEAMGSTASSVTILSLQPGAKCNAIASAGYTFTSATIFAPASGSSVLNGAVVWKPDSSAIVYQEDPADNMVVGPASIVRLDAVSGATPSTVIAATAPGTAGCRTPLGWSVADRLLVTCWSFPLSTPLTITGTLETVAAAGGTRRVLDTATLMRQVRSDFELTYHYGYFVPGTDTVIYNSGATTGGTGATFPAFQIRTVADQTGASSSPFVTPVSALHNESVQTNGGGFPPYPQLGVPNADLVDRFGH